jgi:hypothetical protein
VIKYNDFEKLKVRNRHKEQTTVSEITLQMSAVADCTHAVVAKPETV